MNKFTFQIDQEGMMVITGRENTFLKWGIFGKGETLVEALNNFLKKRDECAGEVNWESRKEATIKAFCDLTVANSEQAKILSLALNGEEGQNG